MESFTSIIALWPSLTEFAADHEITTSLAAVWKHRDSIPSTHWDFTVRAAARHNFGGVTLDRLSAIERDKKRRPIEAAE